jgi:acyl-CoA synthetase (AMP-forming)/AMP-acid ligase II
MAHRPLPPEIAAHPLTRALQACSERPLTLGALILETTARHADRPALVFNGASMTYGELGRRVRALAKALLARGLTKGTRVALLMTNRPEFVISAYAVALAGGVVVPVHSVATPKERAFMLQHSDASMLMLQAASGRQRYLEDLALAHPELAGAARGGLLVPALPYLRTVVCLERDERFTGVDGWEDFIASGAGIPDAVLDAAAAQVSPSDDAVIIYTSGSTGTPKGVVHRHRAACLQQWRARTIYGMAEDERVWSVNPFFWSAGFAFFLGVLSTGACMVIQERLEPAEALAVIERERVTMLASFPTTLAPLADHPDAARRDLSSIRHLPTEAALRRRLDIAEKVWGPTLAWGQTESFASATYVIHGADPEPLAEPGGYPMPGMEFRIVDPDTGRELPDGTPGEITMRGPQVMRGYHKRPPEEGFDADGFVRSGDAGHVDDRGRLHFTGRLTNMIKTRGARVSAMEIEATLARWGRVKSAFVVGVPDARIGESIVACVVRLEDAPVSAEEVVAYLRGELASYKIPARVLFVEQQDIPFTSSNKPMLPKLREMVLARLSAA